MVKNLPANAGDVGSIPVLGRSPREGNGNPFQHSCLEKTMDRGAGQATVHGIAKSWRRLCDFHCVSFLLLVTLTSCDSIFNKSNKTNKKESKYKEQSLLRESAQGNQEQPSQD